MEQLQECMEILQENDLLRSQLPPLNGVLDRRSLFRLYKIMRKLRENVRSRFGVFIEICFQWCRRGDSLRVGNILWI